MYHCREINLFNQPSWTLLDFFSSSARDYAAGNHRGPVFPAQNDINRLQQLNTPLHYQPLPPGEVLALLHQIASPATVRSQGGRYFGFVTGGALPAAMYAKLLATVWDQNAALYIMSPAVATLEEITGKWLLSLLGLPKASATGFVTGATMANFTALAAARHVLLKRQGWNAEADGLFGAPPITVITGDEVHVSVLKALNLIGFGSNRIIRIPTDGQGRMMTSGLPEINGPTILCVQAGNVNTGAFDPLEEIYEKVNGDDVWIHVDGAFGLWAAVSEQKKHLLKGIEKADSWATDAHKWLNVPYDCGLVFVKDKTALFAAMQATAAYLPLTGRRDPVQYVPEMSREARGVAVWAALKSLGSEGLGEMIDRHCRYAQRFAQHLKEAGYAILNEVILNQVLVSFGNDDTTLTVIRDIQQEGTCWCGETRWQGKTAMRISVSSWATTDEDVERSVHAMIQIAHKHTRTSPATTGAG